MPDRLIIPASRIEAVRECLLQADENERFAYGYCTQSDDRWLLADIVPVPDNEMRTQHRTACRPGLAFERDQIAACIEQAYQPLLVHSHPFSTAARFSGQDLEAMDRYMDWLHVLYPETDIGFGVVGHHEFAATVFDAETEQFHTLPVEVIGNWRLDPPVPTDTATTAIDTALHDRSVRLLTEIGQQRLAATTVAVVGTGGLGFILAKQLVRLGVGKLVLIDPDVIERSNLNRLIGTATWDVGRPKVTVLAQQLHDTGLDVAVESVPERVEDAPEALADCDVIVGAVDQVSTRSFLNQYAVQHLRYYLDAGTVIRTDDTADEEQVTSIEGIVQLVAPGANACYACLDRADPERARREHLSASQLEEEIEEGYIEDSALAPEPAVVTLNGTIASQAASIFARLVAGYAPPDMVRYDELDASLQELATDRDETCPTCGVAGMLAHGERDPVTATEADPAKSGLDLAPVDVTTDGGTRTAGTATDRSFGHWVWEWLRAVRP